MKPARIFVAAAVMSSIVTPLHAQGVDPLVDRRIQEIAIVPVEAGTPNRYDIHVIWTVEVNGTAVGVNAGSGILLFLNGFFEVPVASLAAQVQLDQSIGICGFPNCGAGCGGGFVNGVFNTMLCLHEPPTCPSCGCGCQFPWITSTLPDVELEPGDDLVLEVIALGGAFPEAPSPNNQYTFSFQGNSRFWNRRIAVSPDDPSMLIISVVSALGSAATDHDIPVSYLVLTQVNGQTTAEFDLCGNDPWIISPDNLCAQSPPCPAGLFCASSSCSGTNLVHQCEPFAAGEPGFPLPGCGCLSEPVFFKIPDSPGGTASRGGTVTVLIVPELEGLPELPGFGEDDSVIIVPCPADLTGDALVDGADLGALLLQWGKCAGCAADFNSDGEVDGEDLGELLLAWGACFPVS